MSTTYAGANSFPATVTLPSDGDPRNASSVSVPLSGVADRTAYLKSQTDALAATSALLSQAAVMNHKFIAQLNIVTAAWDPRYSSLWFAVVSGTTPQLRYSFLPGNFLVSPNATTDILSGIATAGDTPTDLAVDTSGNVVMACNSRYIYGYRPSYSGTVRVDVAGAVITTTSSVVFDATTLRFIWVSYSSGTPVARYSTNAGDSWSAAIPIAGALGSTPYQRLVVNKTGTILFVRASASGATIAVYKSTNGGSSWSGSLTAITSVSITSGVSAVEASYCAGIDTWFICAMSSSGYTEIWASTDSGATWTSRALLLNARISRISQVGSVLVSTFAPGTGGEFGGLSITYTCFSTDNGVTWRSTGTAVSMAAQTFLGCRQGEGFAIALSNANEPAAGAYVSHRIGVASPAAPLLT